jgi:hypothetical protein
MVNVKNTFTLEEHGLLAYFVRIFFNADRKNLFCKKRGLKYRVKILDCQASRRMESLLEVWEVNFRMTDTRIQVRWREEPAGECKVGPAGWQTEKFTSVEGGTTESTERGLQGCQWKHLDYR